MALTGRFDADFSSFVAACKEAELSLKLFDAGTRQVEGSLNRMVDNFSGRQIISEATLMAEAVTRIGSPARLTADELQRMGSVAQEAVEKLQRIGGDIPPKIQSLADAAARARGETSGLRTSLQAFDGVLASLGVNLGPQIRGIEDIASASGKTAAQLGTLATAGLAVGAGVGGWKLGRAASEFFDLDIKIGDAAAKLLGFGDVAGEKAAAAQTVLAKASKTAGYAITDLAEAMKINEAEANRMIAANQKASATFLQTAADAKKAAEIIASNQSKILKVEHDLAVAKTNFDADDAARKKQAAEDAKRRLSEEINEAARLQKAAHDVGVAFDDAQRLARQRTEEATQALREQEWQAIRLQGAVTSVEYDLSTESGRKRFKELNPSAFLSQAATPEYFLTHTIEDAIREGLLDLYAGYRTGSLGMVQAPPTVGGLLPMKTTTVPNNLDTTIQPLVSFPASTLGATTINVIVSNSGVFDVGSAKKFGDLVGNEFMKKLKMARQLGAS